MTPERWREVEEIYQSAMDRAPELREAHLAESCGEDADLRREVESLLKLNSSPVLVDQPAWQAVGELLDNHSSMAVGTQLGPYRIEGVLGAGGMGQVYRARDTRLGRLVAIKVSREEFGERFEREARAVAALNHRNICTLHDVGPNYLVMELVEGPTLAERIRQGPLPMEEALAIARQIGDALDVAHETGIVHRDLKPGNIKIKADGTVKVLDFGLAKWRPVQSDAGRKPEDSPTISMAATRAGMILGTAAYMSPEQARGQEVDKRADIWAFGVVLYEMLTGRPLFEGATVTDTLAAVLTKEPQLDAVPSKIQRLLRRCLDKEPKERLRDIGDAWALLEEPSRADKPARTLWWVLATTIVTILAAVALMGWWRGTRATDRPVVRLEVNLGNDVSLGSPGGGANTIISPDGLRLAFLSERGLFTRRMDEPKATLLAGTERASAPFFSPDGRWIGFFAQAKLKKISVDGGAPIVLADLLPSGHEYPSGTWGEDDNIISTLGNTTPLYRIPATGGEPVQITERALGVVRWPQVLPGGGAVLFTANRSPFGGFDEASIEVVSLRNRRRKTVQRGGTYGRYVPSGYLTFINKGTLFAVAFDLDRLETRGTPIPVLEQIAYSAQDGSAQMDISRSGTLVYRTGRGSLNIQLLDSMGKVEPVVAKPGEYLSPSLSPDGSRVAMGIPEQRNADLWIYDRQKDSFSRLTFGDRASYKPIWSPDGRYIFFGRDQGEGRAREIFCTRADGAGEPQRLTSFSEGSAFPWSMTPDGKWLAFHQGANAKGFGLWTMQLEREGDRFHAARPEPFAATSFTQRAPSFSPDGKWLAYDSNKSGSVEVYVRSFPDRGIEYQVSHGGGHQARWSRTAHELFFCTDDMRIMVASYTVNGGSFTASKPRLWSDQKYTDVAGLTATFDLARDGKRIMVLKRAEAPGESTSPNHVIFLENFFDELRRRVLVGK